MRHLPTQQKVMLLSDAHAWKACREAGFISSAAAGEEGPGRKAELACLPIEARLVRGAGIAKTPTETHSPSFGFLCVSLNMSEL